MRPLPRNDNPGREKTEGHLPIHKPVMVRECLHFLDPQRGGVYVDATVGGGGHARAIGEALGDRGKLLGIDVDPASLEAASETLEGLKCEWHLIRANYIRMREVLAEQGVGEVAGVLFDLGPCSLHFDRPERGFSFRQDGALDMRYDPEGKVTAGDLVNGLSERELTDILWEHGGERQAGRIAGAIIRERRKRPFSSTLELAECIARAKRGAGGRIHPATRAFQALRIATNSELANLEAGLQAAVDVLGSGGRLAVVSYHSGEHRLLKRFLRKNSGVCVCPPGVPLCVCGRKDVLVVLTRRGVSPSPEEVRDNPRARSGRLRAAEKKEGVG